MGGDEAIEAMDAQLSEHSIIVFRKLAHAKVGLHSPAGRSNRRIACAALYTPCQPTCQRPASQKPPGLRACQYPAA